MNPSSRLDTEAPDLVKRATELSGNERVSLARAIATLACKRTDVQADLNPDLSSFIADTNCVAGEEDKANFAAELERFDEKYFETMDETEDESASEEGLTWFFKARAVASLIYAFDATELTNFCEALYEAYAALGDWEEIRGLCASR